MNCASMVQLFAPEVTGNPAVTVQLAPILGSNCSGGSHRVMPQQEKRYRLEGIDRPAHHQPGQRKDEWHLQPSAS